MDEAPVAQSNNLLLSRPSPSLFPHLSLPEVISQIHRLCACPCVRDCFWGNPGLDWNPPA